MLIKIFLLHGKKEGKKLWAQSSPCFPPQSSCPLEATERIQHGKSHLLTYHLYRAQPFYPFKKKKKERRKERKKDMK